MAQPDQVGDGDEEQRGASAGGASGAHRQESGADQPAAYHVQGTVQAEGG